MKKLLLLLFMLVCCLALCGCERPQINKYPEYVIYDTIQDYAKEEFMESHQVKHYFLEEELDLPLSYIYMISSSEELEEICEETPFEIDFETKKMVICVFRTEGRNYCYMKDVKKVNDEITLHLRTYCPPASGCAGPPYTRIIGIVLDKDHTENIKFRIDNLSLQ